MEQSEIRKLMSEEFARARRRNPAFSLRSFARRLDLFPSTVSEIMNGKRQITRRMGEKILEGMEIEPRAAQKLVSGLKTRNTRAEAQNPFSQLKYDEYRVLSDWYCFGILSLAETEGFKDDPAWIAKRLRVRESEARSALERLERLGMLERSAGGQLRCTRKETHNSTDLKEAPVRRMQAQNLELARRLLESSSSPNRDFSAITMAVDPDKVPQARAMIRDFRRKLCSFMESGRKREVFKLCVQLLPLSE